MATAAPEVKRPHGERPFVYSDMKGRTGLEIKYSPREDGSIEMEVVEGSTPVAQITFPPSRLDEAHILYLEANELLRSRAKIGQDPAVIRGAVQLIFGLFRGEKFSAEQIAAVSAPRAIPSTEAAMSKPIDIDGTKYERLLIRSRLITMADKDLLPIIEEFAGPHLRAGDMLFVSEKALTITQGRIVDMNDIHPTWLARLFARNVGNHWGTDDFHGFGHGTVLAMQLFIEEAGYARSIFAAAVSVITRPLGIHGLFYTICGKGAKSIDCPMSFLILEYAHSGKLAPKNSTAAAKRIKARFGCEAIILDSNYRGAFSLGKTSRNITEAFIGKAFRDNPMGQSDEMTPLCIVRKL